MMDGARLVVRGAVLLIAVAVLVSGPLVGAVDFTHQKQSHPGVGTADVSVVSVPTDNIRLARGRYGTRGYTLRVPRAVVSVHTIRGNPILGYKIRIPELGYVRLSIHVLSERSEGQQYRLTLERQVLDPDRITQDSYDAELLVVLREGNTATTLTRHNVTVAVHG